MKKIILYNFLKSVKDRTNSTSGDVGFSSRADHECKCLGRCGDRENVWEPLGKKRGMKVIQSCQRICHLEDRMMAAQI